MTHAVLDEYWNAGPATFVSRYGRHFVPGVGNAVGAWSLGLVQRKDVPAFIFMNTMWDFISKYFVHYTPIQ